MARRELRVGRVAAVTERLPERAATLVRADRDVEVLALDERGEWAKRGAFEGRVNVRVVPFDAVELELGALWI